LTLASLLASLLAYRLLRKARTWASGPYIYFIVRTFQIGRAAAGTEKGKFVCFKLLLSVELNKTS
jgi:hypothetical protein